MHENIAGILGSTWWRHQMETVSALLVICAGNSPVSGEFPHKGQWRGVLMFSLICARINGWVNNREAGDLRRHPTHCDVIEMKYVCQIDGVAFCVICCLSCCISLIWAQKKAKTDSFEHFHPPRFYCINTRALIIVSDSSDRVEVTNRCDISIDMHKALCSHDGFSNLLFHTLGLHWHHCSSENEVTLKDLFKFFRPSDACMRQ